MTTAPPTNATDIALSVKDMDMYYGTFRALRDITWKCSAMR